jgi:hypothetical protein
LHLAGNFVGRFLPSSRFPLDRSRAGSSEIEGSRSGAEEYSSASILQRARARARRAETERAYDLRVPAPPEVRAEGGCALACAVHKAECVRGRFHYFDSANPPNDRVFIENIRRRENPFSLSLCFDERAGLLPAEQIGRRMSVC